MKIINIHFTWIRINWLSFFKLSFMLHIVFVQLSNILTIIFVKNVSYYSILCNGSDSCLIRTITLKNICLIII